jgi:hypothetical protein
MKLKLNKKQSILIVLCIMGILLFPFETLSQEANPLPLAANWEDGQHKNVGFNPGWQMEKIEKGHNMLLGFTYKYSSGDWFIEDYYDIYYKNPIEKASKYGIPIVIKTTQPESMLFTNPWYSLPPSDNPNVVNSEGVVDKKVSPFGPINHWKTVGECWVNPYLLVDLGYSPADWWSNPLLSRFQDMYPDPPVVIWLSNNEASDVDYREVEGDYRFKETYGSDPDYNSREFKNEVIGGNTELTNPGAGGYETGHGYIPRYNAMFEGMREQLDEWADKIKFVGYEHDPLCFARWNGWMEYNPFPIPGRFSTVPHCWDGTSPSYYINGWQHNTDYTGYAPQIESMNLPFQRNYYMQVKSDFWWEVSTWFDPAYIEKIENEGQEIPPERYGCYAKWVMWLIRPRAVRLFQFSQYAREENTMERNWKWYEPVVDAIDEIHLNPTLERFWKYSEPVLLTDIPHPYSEDDEFWPELFPDNNERMRWYQLPNDITYKPGYSDDWSSIHEKTFNVWIMANVMGTSPEREWLIFAYTPLEEEIDVEAEIPEYGTINLTAKRGGTYYLVRESGTNEYIETEPNVRAAEFEDIELNTGGVHLFNGIHSTAYKCDITDYSWNFGDGTTSDSIVANHSFARPGIYEVRLTVTGSNGKVNSSTMKVTIGGASTGDNGNNGEEEVIKEAHNFPNPFNPNNGSTNIRYSISKPTNVTIKIFDTGNNLVKTLIEDEPQEEPEEEYYNIAWDGTNGQGETVVNGLYFFLLETSCGERKLGKIAVIR